MKILFVGGIKNGKRMNVHDCHTVEFAVPPATPLVRMPFARVPLDAEVTYEKQIYHYTEANIGGEIVGAMKCSTLSDEEFLRELQTLRKGKVRR